MNPAPSGLLLVDKPSGITSHDVVDRVRRVYNLKKVGHAGTLDPLATGVLILLLGRNYTKTANQLLGLNKSYLITLELGWSTDTLDSDGSVVTKIPPTSTSLSQLTPTVVNGYLPKLTGLIRQTVPAYSALKRGGEKLYRRARRGEKVNRPIRQVTVFSLKLSAFQPATLTRYPTLTLQTSVSSGTYTRSLVEDLGRLLGLPAVQTALVRTQVGPYSLPQCHPLSFIQKHPHPSRLLLSS